MSIMRIALRMAAIQALTGRTIVGTNVLDSEIGALRVDADGTMRTEEDTPFIAVYTDIASSKDADTIRSFLHNGETDILFVTGITAAMTETSPDTDETKLIGIGTPATDQALEFHLDLVARQIVDCLTDPGNEWGQIVLTFCPRFISIERGVTSSTEQGVRLAGHQIKLKAELMADPVRGEALKPTSALARFFALAEIVEDAVFQSQIAILKAQISGDSYTWQGLLRRSGLTQTEAAALLIMPAEGAEADVEVSSSTLRPAEPVSS
jgi:hypothetical protein